MSDLGTRRTPYSIPDNTEPFPEDRMSWAIEQIPHLSPQEFVVLLHLSRHSWGRYTKQGDDLIGFVRSEWSSVRRTAEQMSKSRSSIQRAMAGLREKGYITISPTTTSRGSGPSDIKIWWFESDDIMREEVRNDPAALPEIFRSGEPSE